jgi:uncharacterized membrane protein
MADADTGIADENTNQANPPPSTSGLPFHDRINEITTQEPWAWLGAGWGDLCRTPVLSIGYGALFVASGYAVTIGLYQLDLTYMIWPMVAGFILIAPVFCIAFYEISRRLESNQEMGFAVLTRAWWGHAKSVLGAGLALVFFMILWIRVAALIYAINFPYTGLSIQEMTLKTFFTPEGLTFLAVGSAIGAVLAFVAFLVSAVSLQTMMGQQTGFLGGVIISVLAVNRNFLPMMLWAVIIVAVTAIGMACAFVGLAVTLPLLGHASWHAYRSLVREPALPQTS